MNPNRTSLRQEIEELGNEKHRLCTVLFVAQILLFISFLLTYYFKS